MKRASARLFLMTATFVLVTQLFPIVPISQGGQNNNRPRTYSMRVDPETQTNSRRRRRPRSQNWCYRRCRRQYGRCLYWAGNNRGRRRACVIRYRRCLRGCS